MNKKLRYTIGMWLTFIGFSVWDFYKYFILNESISWWVLYFNLAISICTGVWCQDE